MTSPTFVFILTCLIVGQTAQTVALESSSSVRHETRETGENITLQSSVDRHSSMLLFWFKQTLGEKLKPICSFKKYGTLNIFFGEFKDDPRFTMDTQNGENNLKMSYLQMSDSATYYCMGSDISVLEVVETITVSVKGSGVSVPALVHQSESETIQPGGSVTLNCTVHTGTYYCAVVSCGDGTKLDFGDEVSSGVLVYSLSGALISAVILIVVLAFLLYKMNKRICFLSQEIQARFSAPSTTNMEVRLAPLTGNKGTDDVCYAALNINMPNTSRRQRNTARDECVYSSVRQ
ncbi:uncharacterized protein LOC121504953 [Cheilinus undulatus]|uniref:uncharacterized protein LOC121504953 n=1 Tax=Cheilinus undulatus TaxID=241271 RepID=UPI001BD68A3E|nr:uncharacterized protein LOC121504953 [Cheilinus undulatus]